MCEHTTTANQTPSVPLLVDRGELIGLLGVSREHFADLVNAAAWFDDAIPEPLWIGPGSAAAPWAGRLTVRTAELDDWLARRHHAAGATPRQTPLAPLAGCALLDTRGLAAALGLPFDTIKKWAAARIWEQGELPTPITVATLPQAFGGSAPASGQRRWQRAEVTAWLADRQQHHARLEGVA
ncbi:hypothetical protein ER308_08865 [Egibacter rhizosphaerae]|uniref:Uncharacterized protein n=1 Tax=Egibacter rhizosphaerae TaxID=1670831 RepID=A0A411YEW0_9ACTN|nr:hypothetical protein [Egibacter rhizosphaerae]QBI19652.1 hypothetical protein ER308_08865 [Egibacter rhizosphaerae]